MGWMHPEHGYTANAGLGREQRMNCSGETKGTFLTRAAVRHWEPPAWVSAEEKGKFLRRRGFTPPRAAGGPTSSWAKGKERGLGETNLRTSGLQQPWRSCLPGLGDGCDTTRSCVLLHGLDSFTAGGIHCRAHGLDLTLLDLSASGAQNMSTKHIYRTYLQQSASTPVPSPSRVGGDGRRALTVETHLFTLRNACMLQK